MNEPTFRSLSSFRLDRAKRMLREGRDLEQAARALGVRARDLDLALWRSLGERA